MPPSYELAQVCPLYGLYGSVITVLEGEPNLGEETRYSSTVPEEMFSKYKGRVVDQQNDPCLLRKHPPGQCSHVWPIEYY